MRRADDLKHGESMYNVEGKIGGDSDLSPQGYKYAHALPALVKDNVGDLPLEVSECYPRPNGADCVGLDINPAADNTDWVHAAVRAQDVEVFR